MEFKNLIEKYSKVKEDFEKKFTISCQVGSFNLIY